MCVEVLGETSAYMAYLVLKHQRKSSEQSCRPLTLLLHTSQSSEISTNMLRREWLEAVNRTKIRSIAWIFCPGHAGVIGNDAADKLAGNAVVSDSVPMDRAEIMVKLAEKLK